MIGFEKTITIYNQRYDPATKKTTWHKTIISGVSWAGCQKVTTGEGLTSNDGYSVRIPVATMPEGYIHPDEYNGLSDTWPQWKQPTGASDAYSIGEKVSHTGKHWVSDMDANIWEPGDTDVPDAWAQAQQEPWTARNGDVVVLGEGPEVIGAITEITKRFNDCFTVTAVHSDNMARLLPHLRIEGK